MGVGADELKVVGKRNSELSLRICRRYSCSERTTQSNICVIYFFPELNYF